MNWLLVLTIWTPSYPSAGTESLAIPVPTQQMCANVAARHNYVLQSIHVPSADANSIDFVRKLTYSCTEIKR